MAKIRRVTLLVRQFCDHSSHDPLLDIEQFRVVHPHGGNDTEGGVIGAGGQPMVNRHLKAADELEIGFDDCAGIERWVIGQPLEESNVHLDLSERVVMQDIDELGELLDGGCSLGDVDTINISPGPPESNGLHCFEQLNFTQGRSESGVGDVLLNFSQERVASSQGGGNLLHKRSAL